MDLKELKRTVSIVDYLESMGHTVPGHKTGTTSEGNDFYRVNPCPICGHRDHFDVFPQTNTFTSRSECAGKDSSSIIDLMMTLEGLDLNETIDRLEERAGTAKQKPPVGTMSGQTPTAAVVEPVKDYTDLITSWYHKTTTEERRYFHDRGIPERLIVKYKLCFGEIRNERRAIFPVWAGGRCIYYTGRAVNGEEPKYLNTTGSKPLVNENVLTGEHGPVAVLVEGIADALAVEAVTGVPAVATLGAAAGKLTEKLQRAGNVLILTAFDNDHQGDKMRADFAQYEAIPMPKEYKDPCEWQQADPEGMKAAIEKVKTGGSVADYIESGFLKEMQQNRNTVPISTGFNRLDDILSGGFYEGLFVIGGLPATGKTAFMLQLANTVAEQGTPVLYATLEVSSYELTARSISAQMAENGEQWAYISIMRGNVSDKVLRPYFNDYAATRGRNLYIKQQFFGMNATEIGQEAEKIKIKTGKSPIIVVDYLQALKPEGKFTTDKERIDQNITVLKGISDQLHTTVIVLSSFNRHNGETVSMKSFKESGSIEYTADFLAGLESVDADEPGGLSSNLMHPVKLKVLKNRRGPDGLNLSLDFLKPCSLFEESNSVHKSTRKKNIR